MQTEIHCFTEFGLNCGFASSTKVPTISCFSFFLVFVKYLYIVRPKYESSGEMRIFICFFFLTADLTHLKNF